MTNWYQSEDGYISWYRSEDFWIVNPEIYATLPSYSTEHNLYWLMGEPLSSGFLKVIVTDFLVT